MNIDNSSNTYVFDAKTAQAIEEGKNRVTLLQVEELRLNKLKASLEAELIRMEADLAYTTDRFTVKREELDAIEIATGDSVKQLNAVNDLLASTKQDIETRIKATELVESHNEAKSKELIDREAILHTNELIVLSKKADNDMEKDVIDAKIAKIEEFLKSL